MSQEVLRRRPAQVQPLPAQGLTRRVWAIWSSKDSARLAHALIVVAAALLFLSAAATIHVVYTIRPSYAIVAAAAIVGAPFVAIGLTAVPGFVRWTTLAVFAAYVLAFLTEREAFVPGNVRAGTNRDLVYVADLAVGIAAALLVVGILSRRRSVRPLLTAFVAGGVLAAAYGVYQWFAQHYGWPFAHINNTADSNGITAGGPQGPGVFGWERVRGTFLEPHFLATYLASILPLAIASAAGAHLSRRRMIAARAAATVATILMAAAFLLTSSLLGAAILGFSVLFATAIVALARRRVALAWLSGALLVALVVGSVVAVTTPEVASRITGRSVVAVETTTTHRTSTWEDAVAIWERRPISGYGPGQSSVRLSLDREPEAERQPAFVPLRSAHGIWGAALIDAGLIGFTAWTVLFAAIAVAVVRLVVREPTVVTWGLLAAATVAVSESQIHGDRLELRTWLVLGLVLAVAAHPRVAGKRETFPLT
jgi:hypothetical protein